MRSRVRFAWAIGLSALAALSGCRATQVANDGINFRQALLAMYTDQAMDNLIRAKTHQAFVQLDYKDLLVQVTDQYFGQLSNQQQLTTNEGTPLTAVGSLIPRFFQNTFGIQGSAQRQGQMSFHADPITDKMSIYTEYIRFASDSRLFCVTDRPPGKGQAHIQAKYDGCYYWVPCSAAQQFQDLLLVTTIMKGTEEQPPGFYEVTIKDVVNITRIAEDDDVYSGVANFDKPVPNGPGWMIITLSTGQRVRLPLFRLVETPDQKPDDPAVKLGTMIPYLEVKWKVSRDHVTDENIRGAKAEVYSQDYPPGVGPIDVAEEIRHDLNRVRASISPIFRTPGN